MTAALAADQRSPPTNCRTLRIHQPCSPARRGGSSGRMRRSPRRSRPARRGSHGSGWNRRGGCPRRQGEHGLGDDGASEEAREADAQHAADGQGSKSPARAPTGRGALSALPWRGPSARSRSPSASSIRARVRRAMLQKQAALSVIAGSAMARRVRSRSSSNGTLPRRAASGGGERRAGSAGSRASRSSAWPQRGEHGHAKVQRPVRWTPRPDRRARGPGRGRYEREHRQLEGHRQPGGDHAQHGLARGGRSDPSRRARAAQGHRTCTGGRNRRSWRRRATVAGSASRPSISTTRSWATRWC